MESSAQSADDGYPSCLPWASRANAMPALPGPGEQYLETLPSLLEQVRQQPFLDAVLNWPAPGESTTVRDAMLRMGDSGLLKREGRHGVALSPEAEAWLEGGDPCLLMSIFHANVRYIGELIDAVGASSLRKARP